MRGYLFAPTKHTRHIVLPIRPVPMNTEATLAMRIGNGCDYEMRKTMSIPPSLDERLVHSTSLL